MKAKHSPKAMGIRDGLCIGTLQRNLKSELAKVYNCDDMQKRAEQLLTPGALAYYDAGAEDRDAGVDAENRDPGVLQDREDRDAAKSADAAAAPAGRRRARPRRADGVPARRRAPAHRPKGGRARGAPRRGARLCHFRGAARPGAARRPRGARALRSAGRAAKEARAAAAVVESRRRVAIPGHRARDGGAGANVVVLFIQKAPHL